ncbi:MAG: lipoprotein [Rhodothermaceae bacterium]|nr:MAG: lipoprotein [Rhodothermaceae bacterium]
MRVSLRLLRSGRRAFPVLLLPLVLAACAGSAATREADPAPREGWPVPDVEQRLRAGVDAWLGVPHRWGGTSRQGVDCSGLTHVLFRDLFGVTLPRTTEDQARTGRRIPPQALLPGDLVFFNIDKGSRHVGVYLCCGTFAHASSSRGVMISRLDEPYWERAFWMARRVLPLSGHPAPATAPPTTGNRTGW